MVQRAYWAPIVARGLVVCRRCKAPIRPGQRWQLGHPVDAPWAGGNRDRNLAPEHAACNSRGVWVERPPTFAW